MKNKLKCKEKGCEGNLSLIEAKKQEKEGKIFIKYNLYECEKCGHKYRVKTGEGKYSLLHDDDMLSNIIVGGLVLLLLLFICFPNFMLGRIDEKNECDARGGIWELDAGICYNTQQEYCMDEIKMFSPFVSDECKKYQ